jgi:hypothetical protein
MISDPRWIIKPDEIRLFHNSSGRNPPPQNGCRFKSVLFLKSPISLSQFNQTLHKTNRTPLHYIPVLPGHWSGCTLACTGVQKWSSILRDSIHACQKFLGTPSSWSCQACWDQSSSATWGSVEHLRESEVVMLGILYVFFKKHFIAERGIESASN